MKSLGTASALLSAYQVPASAISAERSGQRLTNDWNPTCIGTPFMKDPVWVYDNWSAYTDGIYEGGLFGGQEDKTRLTEDLSLRQLRELVRLKKHGVHFDYYMMNAFWFDPDGAYRKWRQPDWPNGPDRWIAACYEQGIKPGLWFGSNGLWKISVASQWRDSETPKQDGSYFQYLSLFEGGFLADFMETLQYWYDRGIRLFEFDVASFDVATPVGRSRFSGKEIYARNQKAYSDALKTFRRKNLDVMLVAFNDFGGDIHSTATPFPFKKPVDLRWLEVFDTLYTGDIRVSDVPLVNFWRSVDLFNDHMTRRYEQAGIPLERADPFFTLSSTWFGYRRQKRAWKSMLLLSAARGSWKKTIYGDLSLLSEEDARWFAKVQSIYGPLAAMGRTKTFGGIPGDIAPYGFACLDTTGAIYTLVNPTQQMQEIEIPRLSRVQQFGIGGRVLFHDAGYMPTLRGTKLSIGPEQMCLVGFGLYAQQEYDLGIEKDIVIPNRIEKLDAQLRMTGRNSAETEVLAPAKGDLRVTFSHRAADGSAPRRPPMRIEAIQEGRRLDVVQANQDRAISTGISWAAGEVRGVHLKAGQPVQFSCASSAQEPVSLSGSVYAVEYDVLEG